MRQILQNLSNGETSLIETPCPKNLPGHLLIATRNSVVSVGTERMLVAFGKANMIDKARQQPDKVKQVLEKVRTDGLMPTVGAVRSKLDQPLGLGYSNVGTVLEVGEGVVEFAVGDRVISNGPHAEVVRVSKNLCAKVPDEVTDESAAFTVIGSIALQGIRLLKPTLGEAIVVIGLGLIGQMTVQLLRAQGCRVLGIDFDSSKCEIARGFGAQTIDLSKGEDPIAGGVSFSRERGVDGVIITASTDSNGPVHQAAMMCRKRGRIILVGVTGLELSRDDFYKKELTFQVSASYGPGRYDPAYEEEGHDYPIGFVRWTEQRNFEAVLDMMADGEIKVDSLISHRFPFNRAFEAYELLGDGDSSSLGILLEYVDEKDQSIAVLKKDTVRIASVSSLMEGVKRSNQPVVGFIGAGNYASRVLIPAFRNAGVTLKSLATSGGVSGVHNARKYGFQETTTDAERVITDPEIDTVVIATQHNTHAHFVIKALEARKHIFVEKPLAITQEELDDITAEHKKICVDGIGKMMMVGFNRRYAPQIQKIKKMLDGVKVPKSFIMTVNAGDLPPEHWTQLREVGGGRIIGEACHFIDLLRYLANASIVSFNVTMMGDDPGVTVREDKVSFTLQFMDGSLGTVHYFANGHKSFPKERLEIFCAGRVLQLDNFRKLRGYGWPGFNKMNLWRQNKGQQTCVSAFVGALRQGHPPLIPFDELLEVSRVSIEIAENR